MKALFGSALTGLPALVGVLLGIRTFTGGRGWVIASVGLIVLALVSLFVAKRVMHSRPLIARWFVEVWILASVGVMSLATAAILWVGLEPLPSFLGTVTGTDATKSVTGAFAGAITAYVALVWTKDISDAKGAFWPSYQFKQTIGESFKKMVKKPGQATCARAAMFDDTIEGVGPVGWEFKDRGVRAKILADFLATP
ncbi:hypothetical protein EOD23_20235 [Mesorhizobium sp. USDA-HM6]|nr:hypothetical protein EOD23_20235 [Mesorhizobium sp. USDA-HM6]